jgi:hypothetical protein
MDNGEICIQIYPKGVSEACERDTYERPIESQTEQYVHRLYARKAGKIITVRAKMLRFYILYCLFVWITERSVRS